MENVHVPFSLRVVRRFNIGKFTSCEIDNLIAQRRVFANGKKVTQIQVSTQEHGKPDNVYPILVFLEDDSTMSCTMEGKQFTDSDSLCDLMYQYAEEVPGKEPSLQQPNILTEATELIYGERAAAYGPVTVNFGRIAERWSQIFGIKVTREQALLAMIDLKISRHINAPKRDNLVDIAGYIGCLDKLSKGE